MKTLTSLLVGVVIVAGLYLGREVLVPITIAILLSFLVAPLVNLLRRVRFGQVPSVLVSVFLSLAVVLVLGGLIGTQVAGLASDVPRYQATIQHKVDAIQGTLGGKVGDFIDRATHAFQRANLGNFGAPKPADTPAAVNTLPRGKAAANAAANDDKSSPPPAVPVEVREPPLSPFKLVMRILAPVLAPLETTGIVFIVAIFILLEREELRDRLIRLFGSRDLHRTTTAMDDAAKRLSRYFLAQVGINTGMGLVIGLGLALVGVPHPILWAGLAALLRFVPYVGAWIAALLATALAAAVDPGWSMAIWTLGLFVIAELIAGQIVEPMLYGHSTGLSPLSVIVAAIFWSWLWGPIGLILSTPLTLCLVVLGRHVDRLEFLDVLLGDRPALTPVQNFYQRMLAGDPDEALGQAEVLLRDRPLSAYYDEVAIKGLRLAANDVARGVVTDAQFERIRAAAIDLIDSLSNASDGKPDTRPGPEERDHEANNEGDFVEPSAAEQRVPHTNAPAARSLPIANANSASGDEEDLTLCIAGRGPLDDIAAKMMAQLLEKHGLRAAVVAHGEASRSRISELDISRVGRACAIYLDADAVPSSVRYLLRRTRERLPQTPLIVGLIGVLPTQPRESGGVQPDEWADVSGSVWRVASLKEAVEACLAVQPVLTTTPKTAAVIKAPSETKTELNADGLSEVTAPAIAAEASTAHISRQGEDNHIGAVSASSTAAKATPSAASGGPVALPAAS